MLKSQALPVGIRSTQKEARETMHGDIREGLKGASLAAAVLLGACLMAVSGCSSTVDEADRTASPDSGTVSGVAASPVRPPDPDAPFPALGDAPVPPSTSTAEERRELAEGLVSDRARSRYSNEAIAFQGEPAAPLQPPEQLVTEADAPSSLASQMTAIEPPFSGAPAASTPPASEPITAAPPPPPPPSEPIAAAPTPPPSEPVAEPPPAFSPPAEPSTVAAATPPTPRERMATDAVTPPFSGETSPPLAPFPPQVPDSMATTTAADVASSGAQTERALEPGFPGTSST
jgi:hypothetical protein